MRIFSQLPDLPSASQRLACASVSPLSLPSVSRDLCALVSAHQATVYYCRAYVLLFRLTSHSASRGFCVLVLAHWPSLNAAGLMCSFGSPGPPSALRFVCTGEVCMPRLSWQPGHVLCTPQFVCTGEVCMLCHSQLPRPVSCTARVVCTAEVCMLPLSRQPGPPSVLRDCYGLLSVPQVGCLVGATVRAPFMG